MDVFWAAPPVIRYAHLIRRPQALITDLSFRTLTALTLVQSALMHSGLVSLYWAPFMPSMVFSWRPQIYRLVTPFLLTAPNLGFIFDLYLSMMPRYHISLA